MLYRRRRSGVLPGATTLVGNTEVDNVDHTRHFILNIFWEGARQGLAHKFQVAKIHSQGEFWEVQLA